MRKTVKFEAPDISAYQGTVNVKAVRDSGYRHIGIRAGYGRNNVDQRYVNNAQACANLGVKALLYWFSYAYTEAMAAAEAGYAIAQAKKYWKCCPIAYDLEYDTRRFAATRGVNIDRKLATDLAIAFLKEIKLAGYTPVLYANRDYLRNFFDMGRITAALGRVYVWFALYGAGELSASEAEAADLWQYTSTGSVAGISGNVDLNRVYTDIWETCVSTVTSTAKTEYGSYTVVKGDTLSGIGRKLGVAWKEIAAANGLTSPYTIQVRQKLKIPYEVNEVVSEREPEPNLYIRSFQEAANEDGYKDANGRKLAVNGMDDAATQFVRRQIRLQAKQVSALWVERSTGKVVGWLQGRLREGMETSLEVTGEYDAFTVSAVRELQRKFALTVDGIAGYNTIQVLFYN